MSGIHHTDFVYSKTLSLDELSRLLYEKAFKSGLKSASYKVVPESIR